ncbi:hypothetical protein NH340_JMT04721 [Sarcoptes scabiei]|nr:hypothetical protein NH340_JMT04721 [Sarcoptes scabiei]
MSEKRSQPIAMMVPGPSSKIDHNETEDERRKREEREYTEKNEMSLIRMLVKHNRNIAITGNMNIFKSDKGRQQSPLAGANENNDDDGSDRSGSNDSIGSEEGLVHRDELHRTASMVSWGPRYSQKSIMSKRYKLITSSVLWFCYFSLALNDYVFGPTFNDFSTILSASFEQIAYFAVYRQLAYTFGSLGGLAFDYVNRQLLLILLLLLSAASLFATPYVPNISWLFVIAIINGFAAGACDVGFHVWILEMFQNGGGPLIQALHFSFGIGIAIAPLISANFLGSEAEGCGSNELQHHNDLDLNWAGNLSISNQSMIDERRFQLFIPYSITGSIVALGGLILLVLFFYKRYHPPQERKLPVSFDEQMPKQLTRSEKIELWKRSVPSFYIISIILLGSLLIWSYYGLEVTYLQFLAQFSNAVPLPIHGTMSANLEAATGTAYAIGGLLATIASFRVHSQHMIYVNFFVINLGTIVLWIFSESSLLGFWIGNILVGLGFSSCYATAYTFLEHQINVTNVIGSIFLFAGGSGTALFPILLAELCSKPLYLVYLSFFCTNLALLLFVVMHVMTGIRYRQVKLIQDRLLKDPAMLTKIRQRTLSQLSWAPK